jgi:U4/U6 small nuclear ribonucleoprotein PRP31
MLVSQAGGLGPLSKQPACNVLVLGKSITSIFEITLFSGKQKKTLSGFSTAAIMPHAGFIYYHPLVQSLPPEHRRKAARVIAAKCKLISIAMEKYYKLF